MLETIVPYPGYTAEVHFSDHFDKFLVSYTTGGGLLDPDKTIRIECKQDAFNEAHSRVSIVKDKTYGKACPCKGCSRE